MPQTSDFKHEYNNDGNWVNALVKDWVDDHTADLVYIRDDGSWGAARAPRGDGPGEFRAKT